MLEYISCEVRESEDVFSQIDDPEELLLCEDRIAEALCRIGKSCAENRFEALLNARYTHVFNRPVPTRGFKVTEVRRFKLVYSLVVTARHFFGVYTSTFASKS